MTVLRDALLLTKISFIDSFNLNALKGKSDSKRTLMMAAVFVLLLPYLFILVWQMAGTLASFGMLRLLLDMAVLGVCFTTLITTVYKASGYLFKFRDFDLLMSLPVKPGAVFISKISMLFITNMLPAFYFSLTFLLIYGIKAGEDAAYYIISFLLFPLLSVIPTMLGCLFSFVISRISSKMRRTNLASIIGMIFALVMIVGIQLISASFANGSDALKTLGNPLSLYPIGELYVNAAVNLNALDLLLFVCINLGLLVLFVGLLSKSFRSINALLGESSAGAKFKMKPLSSSSALVALLKKELRFFFSSPVYMMNTGIGILLLVIYSGALLFFGADAVVKMLELPGAESMIKQLSFAIMSFTVALCMVSAVSISMEGKSFWILKSLPLNFSTIAGAKILANMVIIVPPFLLSSVLLTIVLKYSAAEYLLFLLTGLLLALFTSVVGLVVNLQFPKLEWKLQVHVVKQSMSTFVAVLIGMVVSFGASMLFVVTGLDFIQYVLIVNAVLLASVFVLWRILMTRGARQFYELN